MDLAEFNRAEPAEAKAAALVWANIPAWAEAVVMLRPFASVEEAAAAAASTSSSWDAADLDAALAHHPRIGQKPVGSGTEAEASRREQAAMSDASADVTTAMAQANADYEQRFGRVFLIRAAGRSPENMLAEIRRRLGNDDGAETAEAIGQLRQIALLRLRTELAAAG